MKFNSRKLFLALASLVLFTLNSRFWTVSAQGTTAFTYQGQLRDNGTNANGTYTMVFNLYDSPSGGKLIGGPITTGATLANGLFTVNLDFGASAFNGSARYLDITVQSGSDSEELSPRVQVLPTPYAQFAAIAATVTNGAITSSQLAANAVATTNIQNGAIMNAQLAANAVASTNIQNGAIMNAQLAPDAVMDTNIVSLNGAKVTGTVASAMNASFSVAAAELLNGLWVAYPVTNDDVSDVLDFTDDGTTRMLILPNGIIDDNGRQEGVLIAGDSYIQGGGLLVDDSLNSGGDLNVDGDASIGGSVSAQAFNTTSDRNLKANFAPIDRMAVLDRVVGLPISSWNFKADKFTKHIGPMAQDFYAAFNVGMDDRHIATVDEGGVALAAIQGLNQKLEAEDKAKDEKIVELQRQLADLKKQVQALAASQTGGAK